MLPSCPETLPLPMLMQHSAIACNHKKRYHCQRQVQNVSQAAACVTGSLKEAGIGLSCLLAMPCAVFEAQQPNYGGGLSIEGFFVCIPQHEASSSILIASRSCTSLLPESWTMQSVAERLTFYK